MIGDIMTNVSLEKLLTAFNAANDLLKSNSVKPLTTKGITSYLNSMMAHTEIYAPDSMPTNKPAAMKWLEKVVQQLRTAYQTAHDAAEAAAKAKQATYLDELAEEIGECLDDVQTKSQRIGELLLLAREEMTAQGKKAEFLPWCYAHFCFSKAHTYRLMRIAEFLKEDKRFTGVAMRVLYRLIADATPEVLEKAAELAGNGSLNSGTLQALLEPKNQAEPAKQEPATVTVDAQASLDNVQEKQALATQTASGPDDAPFDIGDSKPVQSAPVYVEQAQAELRELRQQLDSALAEIRRLTTPAMVKTAQVAPMLRQFKSYDAQCTLGLTTGEAQDKQAIKTAFREFIKLGYGDGHEAYPLLCEAQELLLLQLV